MIVMPACHVFEMFNVHHGATLLPADVTCLACHGVGGVLCSMHTVEREAWQARL